MFARMKFLSYCNYSVAQRGKAVEQVVREPKNKLALVERGHFFFSWIRLILKLSGFGQESSAFVTGTKIEVV